LLFLLAALLLPSVSIGGCKTDCRDEYESARDDCLHTYDDPDEAEDLQACLEDAKSSYEDCTEECES
jgi:hypothetical protein